MSADLPLWAGRRQSERSRNPRIESKCLRFLVTRPRSCSIAVAATRASGSRTPNSRDPTGALGHGPVDAKFSEGREQLNGEVRCGVAGEEFCAGNHRVVEPVATGYESCCSSEVVDEDVGVDEEISHAATRRARAWSRPVRRQTWP